MTGRWKAGVANTDGPGAASVSKRIPSHEGAVPLTQAWRAHTQHWRTQDGATLGSCGDLARSGGSQIVAQLRLLSSTVLYDLVVAVQLASPLTVRGFYSTYDEQLRASSDPRASMV